MSNLHFVAPVPALAGMRDEHLPPPGLTDVRCTVCRSSRIARHDGSAGVCSYLQCPAPMRDADAERFAKRFADFARDDAEDILTLAEVP